MLKKAQVVKVLPKKIDKPFIQKQDLFNTMVNKFEDKGVSFSQSENAPRQKYRFSDQASLRSHWNCVKDRPVWKKVKRSQVLPQNSSRASNSTGPISFHKLDVFSTFQTILQFSSGSFEDYVR